MTLVELFLTAIALATPADSAAAKPVAVWAASRGGVAQPLLRDRELPPVGLLVDTNSNEPPSEGVPPGTEEQPETEEPCPEVIGPAEGGEPEVVPEAQPA